MTIKTKILIGILVIVIILAGGWWIWNKIPKKVVNCSNIVSFKGIEKCSGKEIKATGLLNCAPEFEIKDAIHYLEFKDGTKLRFFEEVSDCKDYDDKNVKVTGDLYQCGIEDQCAGIGLINIKSITLISEIPVKEKGVLYVLTQNLGSLFFATEPTEKFDWPYFEILKIDLKSSKIVKKVKGEGFGIKVKKGGDIYLLNYRFPDEIRNFKDVKMIVKAIQELKSWEDLEKFITIYDENLNQIASYSSNIFDFEANENYLYGLGDKHLDITDYEDPTNPQKVSSLSLKKTAHDIIFRDNKLYILDNIVMPLYLHIVDVKNPKEPKLYSYQTWGINAHLVTQDVVDRWFVLESYAHMGGGGKNILVFNITFPIEEVARIVLSEYGWPPEPSGMPKVLTIEGIKVVDNYLYALNSVNSDTVELLTYDLKDFKEAEHISTFTLEENKKLNFLRERGIKLPWVWKGNFLYYGGDNGVYIIDVSNPSKPSKKDIIKTDFQVISLELE